MRFEWYLALRYFRGTRKGAKFISFIKAMSITGVAIGSAGLLIALSIVHGFKSTIYEKIVGFAPHITITTFTDASLDRADTLFTYLDQFPEIQSKQIVIEGQVMIQTKDGVSGTVLKGVDENGNVSDLKDYISRGSYDLTEDETGIPGIVIGSKLAQQIKADIGSKITVYTIEGIPSLINSPEIRQFRLAGIYQTGIDRFDGIYAMVAREHARKLFGFNPNEASGIELKLTDSSLIEKFDKKLDDYVTFPYYKESIYARYGNIFAWVELQESMIPLVISVMTIVAAFNLIGTVLMMVLERTRDIGILKTIGSKSKIIRRIFIMEGIMVSSVGIIIGIGISLLFNFLQKNYHIIPLSEENYYMSYAPVEPHGLDFVIVIVVTLILCSLASWLPARIAAKTDPIKVIAFGR